MTRIVSGTAGGRRLKVPPGETTRPTSDRVREALFSALEASGALEDATVLDLYAGSGALGLEAASRGAARVVLVEAARPAAATARANVAAVGLDGVSVVADRVQKFLATPAAVVEHGWDLVFCDPPYAVTGEEVAEVLDQLEPLVASGATVVVERSSRTPEPRWPGRFTKVKERKYGETTLWVASVGG